MCYIFREESNLKDDLAIFFSVLHEQTREHFTWIVPLYVFECKGKLCNHSSKRVARSQKVSGTPLNFSLYHYFSIIKLNPFFSGKFCEMLIGIQHCNFLEVPPWSISSLTYKVSNVPIQWTGIIYSKLTTVVLTSADDLDFFLRLCNSTEKRLYITYQKGCNGNNSKIQVLVFYEVANFSGYISLCTSWASK